MSGIKIIHKQTFTAARVNKLSASNQKCYEQKSSVKTAIELHIAYMKKKQKVKMLQAKNILETIKSINTK